MICFGRSSCWIAWWAGEGGKRSGDDTSINLSQQAAVNWVASAVMQLVSSSGLCAVPRLTPPCVHSTDNCLSACLLLRESFISTEMLQGRAGQALQPQGFTALSSPGSEKVQRAAVSMCSCQWGSSGWIHLPESASQSTVIE